MKGNGSGDSGGRCRELGEKERGREGGREGGEGGVDRRESESMAEGEKMQIRYCRATIDGWIF